MRAVEEEGNWNLALNVFQNMLKQPNLIACNASINLLGKAGEIKLAFKVKLLDFKLVLVKLLKSQKVALEVYEHMVHQKCTLDTFTNLSLIAFGHLFGMKWRDF
ncbi:hypothetical protein Peur_015665 [Populus x canadensis]